MPSKKVNPRNRPATYADVVDAFSKGTAFGLDHALYLVLFVLLEKHDATPEELEVFTEEFNHECDQINRGYSSWAELRHILIDEYHVELFKEVRR